MLYLIEGSVSISYYMRDDRTVEAVTRLVEAPNKQEAELKFTKHFEDQTSEYSVYYWARVDCVSEVIS
jgi:hypothetical protein